MRKTADGFMKNRGDVFGLEPSQSAPVGRIQLPRRGSFFAITETYRMNDKSLWQCYKRPPLGELASRSDD